MYSNAQVLVLLFLLVLNNLDAQKPIKNNLVQNQIIEIEPSQSRSDDNALLNSHLLFGPEVSMEAVKTYTDPIGYSHLRYQQYYKGIRVEGAQYTIHKYRGKSVRLSGNYLNIGNINTTPKINKNTAIQIARAKVPSSKLANHPDANNQSELVIYYHLGNHQIKLAYKVDVYNIDPVFRADVYVDAINGKIIDQIEKIHTTDIEAHGNALYNGSVAFMAEAMEVDYRLRSSQNKNETYSLAGGTDYSSATDISSKDLMFDEDPVAVQAHWGTENTYQYFMDRHQRNSFDGNGTKIKSYVHYSTDYSNAFWDGLRLTFGDGNGTSISPLVSLDVVAHEITHGVTQHSAGLIYKYEPGALNESFSDIFAESVEYYVTGGNDWLIGKDIYTNGEAIRSMSNPKEYNDPDTYMGNNWYSGPSDNGGVHTNSGVQNKWFVLLADGGTGINDHGETYAVSPIGLVKSSEIAYRNLTVYLNPYSNLYNARQGSIQAAIDLYGEASPEVISVTNAWYAVGVGSSYDETGCKSGDFSFQLKFDNYPEETSWELKDNNNVVVASGGPYTTATDGSTINQTIALASGDYSFIINDVYGDGICCGYGNGSYILAIGGTTIRRGSYFAGSDITEFCIEGDTAPPPDLSPPTQPEGIKINNITTSSADVSWNPSTDDSQVLGYNMYLDNIFYQFTESTSVQLLGLQSSKEYQLGLEAVDNSENISERIIAVFTTLTPIDNPPSEPTNVLVSNISYNSATLTWNPSQDDGSSVTYHVYVNDQELLNTSETSVELSSLSSTTTYQVYIQAEDDATQLSTYSIKSFTTLEAPDEIPPSFPENLLVTDLTASGATISWNESFDESGIQYYEIYLDDTYYTSQIETSLILTGLTESTFYGVRIRAVDNNNNVSIFSSINFTTLTEQDQTPPSIPENLDVSSITHHSATAFWEVSNDDAGISHYEVYLDDSSLGYTIETNISLNGLLASTVYTLKIRAVDVNDNKSGYTSQEFETLPAPDVTPPTPPSNLSVHSITSSSAIAEWDASTDNIGISHYEIYLGLQYWGNSSATNFSFDGLLESSDYEVRIRAVDLNNNMSEYASQFFETTQAPDVTPPTSPQNIGVHSITLISADINWEASTDNRQVIGYNVYLNEEWQNFTTQLYYPLQGLFPGTEYEVSVIAIDNSENESTPSLVSFSTIEEIQSEEELILGSYFETGWEGWNDGGSDSYRYRGNSSIEGTYSIRLRDNSGTRSSMFTDQLDISSFNNILFRFSYLPVSMERDEDFFVELFDGNQWNTIGRYINEVDFSNGNIYQSEITIGSHEYEFSTSSLFRIRCDASSNADKVYIDEVEIIGNPNLNNSLLTEAVYNVIKGRKLLSPEFDDIQDISISPNPASDLININIEGRIRKLKIFSVDGKLLMSKTTLDEPRIDISKFNNGLYILELLTEEGIIFREKFFKR